MPSDYPSIQSLIQKVNQHAKTIISDKKQCELFSKFVSLFYSQTSVSDLKNRAIQELFSIAYTHWKLVCVPQTQDEPHLRILNPTKKQDGWDSPHTVVMLIVKDMPFIVDSTRMAINRMGFTTHLMIYMGGMKVCRDEKGCVTDIAAYHAEATPKTAMIEAPVYIEIDKQTDPDVLSMMEKNLQNVLHDVRMVVQDWRAMRERVQEAIEELSVPNPALSADDVKESIAFLEWLLDDQFTFLGVRDYEVIGMGDMMALQLRNRSGLGVLRDESYSKVSRLFSELPDTARESMLSTGQLLVISKTNTISTVHREAYTDYIGIKRFSHDGKLMGERRIIGLYTSTAYSSQPKQIPFLRHKVVSILVRSGLPPKSHAGKDLMHILDTFPRDDLFQGSVDELSRVALEILNLQDRRKLRLFVREDAYNRYVSCLVYVPRDNFNAPLITRMQNVLQKAFNGIEINYETYFYTPTLTRIHYVIRLPSKKPVLYDAEKLEAELTAVAKSWQDGLKEMVPAHFDDALSHKIIEQYADAFSAGYREVFSPMQAVKDIEHIEALTSPDRLGMHLYRPLGLAPQEIKFKLFRHAQTVPLSDALPILENLGLRVIDEQAYQLVFKNGQQLWINDFTLRFSKEMTDSLESISDIFQEAFQHIWLNDAENDALNALVVEAKLNWREISVLRAYVKYLRQIGFTYSPHYIAETFLKYPMIATSYVQLFHRLFNPKKQKNASDSVEHIESSIVKQIDAVQSLDEDRIFRRILSVMKATLRTNFFQHDKSGAPRAQLSLKLLSGKIPELPLPVPLYEIFVYSPRFEGIHLRSSKVARGGLRWSDRREDFRTEILGLMKAQTVKNAVIVPSGAKGGFVPKNLPNNGSREDILQEGIACYQSFVTGLLEITDNRVGTKIVSPQNTVCYDDADPYLVVAADKGTATFSDIANQIAVDHGFWLGDAFASGGSTGYDHKKMGITARGAWVSVERHFQGFGVDVNQTDITAVGIGDLSGDVFGNGVLRSVHLKLVAAFNHMHIFLDPTPNAEKSFAERQRLFALPRSTWADYSENVISKGGGIYPRSAKSIMITPEVKNLLEIAEDQLSPNELIHAILKAPVDLIWNGGIGTYVKAAEETHTQVGDRTNDAVRVNGEQLRARVVGEGGNLGFTQLGRIEYALLGGLINTDFIDNSGGVDCSDHEVNIKILLNTIVEAGDLALKQRNQLLASMTNEVGDLVLENNYHQNEAVSFLSLLSPRHMGLYIHYLDTQESLLKINRSLEYLPDSKTMQERRANQQGLTRPEIAVLLSYSKIILKADILSSDLLQDKALCDFVMDAFPTVLRKKYSAFILKHRLRDAILATQLSNHVVSYMGITFVHQMMDETGATPAEIVRAFIIASRIFDVEKMYADIEALDYRVDMKLQYQMMDEVVRLVRRASRWLLRNWRDQLDIAKTIAHFEPHLQGLYKRLPKLLLGSDKEDMDTRRDQLMQANVPEEIALRIASARSMYHALNVVQATTATAAVYDVAYIYFALIDRLDLHWFRDKINDHPVTHRWSVLAKAAFKSDLDWISRELTSSVIGFKVQGKSVSAKLNMWLTKNADPISRWRGILADLHNEEISDFSIISVGIRELFDLAQAAIKTA